MSETRDASAAPDARWQTWLVGGILVGAAGVMALIGLTPTGTADLAILTAVAVFAIGFSREGSVTARRPVGTAALLLYGASITAAPMLLGTRLERYMFSTYGQSFGLAILHPAEDPVTMALAGATAAVALVGLGAAVVAGVSIIRARCLTAPLSWLPLALMVMSVLIVFAVVALRALDAAILDPMHLDRSGPVEQVQGPATLVAGLIIIVLALIERARSLTTAPARAQV